jgi:hypothetical protein
MVLGFKERFVKPILERTKIHSIRTDEKNRWKPLILIHFATGVRTKNYNQFKLDTCKSVQTIEIIYYKNYFPIVKIDNRKLKFNEIIILAKNDGFNSLSDFFEWFNSDYKGKIIHWTDFKY